MSAKFDFENFLLNSLIEDLNDSSLPVFRDTYEKLKYAIPDSPKTNVNSSKDRLTDFTEKSDDSLNKTQNPLNITHEDIILALSDQKSTLNLQKIIKEMSPEDIEPLIEEIKGGIAKMMTNRNGNYFCTDIFNTCNSTQRLSILNEIAISFESISNNEFGTHPIQALIDHAKTLEEINLITTIVSNKTVLISLCHNPNGSYVIQKIITNIPERLREEFNYLLIENLIILANNTHGVCIMKKFISYIQNNFMINYLLDVILRNFFFIAENQYGNYLIQSILEVWWNKKEAVVFKKLVFQSFYRLSVNQFGSHIAETFITMLSIGEQNIMLRSLMQNGLYYHLINVKYGMFVMNKLFYSLQKNMRMKNNNVSY